MSDLRQRAEDFAAGWVAGQSIGSLPHAEEVAFRGYLRDGWEIIAPPTPEALVRLRALAEILEAEQNER